MGFRKIGACFPARGSHSGPPQRLSEAFVVHILLPSWTLFSNLYLMVSLHISVTFVGVNCCRQDLNQVMALGAPFLGSEEQNTAGEKNWS